MNMLDAPEVRILGELQRLELRPGDKFVLMCDRRISSDNLERLKAYWHQFAGEEHKLLVLDDGLKLGVISTTEP